jgi:hypothetical protein
MSGFMGIKIIVNQHMPADEIWLLEHGVKSEIHVHEGPQAGLDVEVWIRQFKAARIINMGEIMAMPKPKEFFELPAPPNPTQE